MPTSILNQGSQSAVATERAKVAIVLPQRFSPVRGGALAIWTAGFCAHVADDYEITVLCLPDSDEYGSVRREHIDPEDNRTRLLEATPWRIRSRLPRGVIRWFESGFARRAGRCVRVGGYDIVHIQDAPKFVPMIRKANPDARVLLHLHTVDFSKASYTERCRIIGLCDRVVFCSSFIQREITKGLSDELVGRCKVTYNGVDTTVFHPGAPWPARIPEHPRPYLLFLGRITPLKGAHLLFDELPALFDRFPDLDLLVVGAEWFGDTRKTPYISELEARAARFPGRVRFLGSLRHDELPGIFAHAQFFVNPSLYAEGFPLVNLEAMAAGTPVVASNRGGTPEAIGDAGIIFDPDEPGELRRSLISIAANSKLRADLAMRGLDRVQTCFDWRVIAAGFGEHYSTSGIRLGTKG